VHAKRKAWRLTPLAGEKVLMKLIALFFAGLAFNRHRQLVRSYAEVEQIVAQRTRELERANQGRAHH